MPEELNKIEQNNQSYISRVRLKGYKSIIDTEVELKPGLNIIIGANGSGKTNFVEFLDSIFDDKLESISSLYSANIKFYINNKEYNYTINYKLSKSLNSNTLIPNINEVMISNGKILEVVMFSEFLKATYISYGIPESFQSIQNLIKIEILSFNEDEEPYYDIDSEPIISYGLKELFMKMLLVKLEEEILETKLTIPNELNLNLNKFSSIEKINISEGINIKQIKSNKWLIDYIKFEFLVNGQWLTWNQLSDGTKRMFYIITEVTFANNVVILEEPELGIHPDQLRKLMSFLREQAEDKQIILTTHSPQVLNILDPDDLDRIIISKYDKEKGTQLYHLTEEEIEHARGYMQEEGLFLSDYWVYSGFDAEKEHEEV